MKTGLLAAACLAGTTLFGAAPVSEAMRIYNEIQVTNKVMNLRNAAWLEKSYAAALGVVSNADERARIAMGYAKFKYDFALDDDYAKWRQAQRDAYATPGASAAVRLDLLKKGVAGLDFETEGWKLVEHEDARLQQTYFWELVDRTRFGTTGIEEATSGEHRLAVCDKALALLGDNAMNGAFLDAKVTTLERLGRVDEAEKVIEARLASAGDNARLRYQALVAQGEFYRRRAARYYADADRPTLRRALASLRAALVEMRKFDERPNAYMAPVDVAFELGDYAAVEELLAGYKACHERRKLKFPDAFYAQWAGDLAYFRGDYEAAVAAYGSVKDLPRARTAESHFNRYLSALYVTGRYDEALAVVPKLVSWCSLADRNTLYKRILQAKIAKTKKE